MSTVTSRFRNLEPSHTRRLHIVFVSNRCNVHRFKISLKRLMIRYLPYSDCQSQITNQCTSSIFLIRVSSIPLLLSFSLTLHTHFRIISVAIDPHPRPPCFNDALIVTIRGRDIIAAVHTEVVLLHGVSCFLRTNDTTKAPQETRELTPL
jgi:hypothetical protein